MLFREYQSEEKVVNFYACGLKPYNKLSNFAFIKEGILFEGIRYYSTEHAFQAQKYIEEQRHRFSIDGDLGNVESGFKLIFGDNWQKKRDYWMKKNNIGIIAKMSTNVKLGKKLGLIRCDNFVSTDHMWLNILALKYNIEEFKIILQNTENKYLLEFDRGAKNLYEKYGKSSFWGGIIQNDTLYGHNMMGKYLMNIRYEIMK